MSQLGGIVLFGTSPRGTLGEVFSTLVLRSEAKVVSASVSDGLAPVDAMQFEFLPKGLEATDHARWLCPLSCLDLDVATGWSEDVVKGLMADAGPAVLGHYAPTEMAMRFGPHAIVNHASGRRLTRRAPAQVSLYLWGYSTPQNRRRFEARAARSPALARVWQALADVAYDPQVAFLWEY